jgi:hypothetical protein
MDRGAVTAALGQAPPWRSFELSDARVVRAADDTAPRTDDGWRLVLYQQTALAR